MSAQDLAVLDDGYDEDRFFDGRTWVTFQQKGASPPRLLIVELERSVYFSPWRPVKLRQEFPAADYSRPR
jgi:hypothetical protein